METAWKGRVETEDAADSLAFRRLTVEIAVYGLIMLAGLVLRLASLGRWPLMETGVNTALAAWRTLQGSAWRPLRYVPLIYDANLVLFGLTRATDATTRLLPVIAGAGLVLMPYFARDVLGRKGALAASLLLAFAPTWVFFSRTSEGSILTAAASALLLLSASSYLSSKEPRDAALGAVALGLGLTAGPGIYTLLVSTLLFGIVWWLRHRDDEERRTVFVGRIVGAATKKNLLLFLGIFLFFASGFLVNTGGIGASIELAGWWARDLSPASSDLAWSALPKVLLTYELLTLALALVGGIEGLRRRDQLDIFLVSWVAVALVSGMLLGHRQPIWLTDALLPLVILAARGFQHLWDSLSPGATITDGVAVLVALALLAFGFLELAAYTHTGQEKYVSYARIGWGLTIIAWAAYWYWAQRDAALRVAVVVLGLCMLILTVRATTAVAYQNGRDPREGLVYHPSSLQLADFETFVLTLSSRQAGDPHILDIVYEESLDPWMGWYLRDYPNARQVASVGAQPQATALVTPARAREAWPSGYVGQRFRLQETRPKQRLTIRERLRWLFYRDAVGTEEATELHIWVKLPTGE